MQSSTAAQPSTPSASALIYEATVKVAAKDPPGMFASASQGEAKPLDAHHKMLYEGSILSSHLRTYQENINKYLESTKKFFAAADDFLLSAGQPSQYETKLSEQGARAAAAASAALATAAGTASGSEQSTGNEQTPGSPTVAPPAIAAASTRRKDANATATTNITAGAGNTAFGPEASQPTLPVGPSPVGGVYLCPGVPGTPALGAVGLTQIVPADICLPAQHESLFRHDMQRGLVGAGRDELAHALQDKLLPALQVWLATFDECKALLPQAERMRLAEEAARNKLDQARQKVMKSEAAKPLVSEQQLQQEGQMPRVLVQSSAAGGLIAEPAAEERQEMYKAEKDFTDTSLAFELTEKVLRDKLTWLMKAGGGLKATTAAAMAHALRAAAAQGEPGTAAGGTAAGGTAAGGTAAGNLRAPREELLEPFPQHVLARLAGDHLPTLPQLVQADAYRLGRWGARYRDAMQSVAAASAAAAGAQMLAAAAAPAGAVTSLEAMPETIANVIPGGAVEGLARTDDSRASEQAAGTAAGVRSDTGGDSSTSSSSSAAAAAESDGGAAAGGEVTATAVATESATAASHVCEGDVAQPTEGSTGGSAAEDSTGREVGGRAGGTRSQMVGSACGPVSGKDILQSSFAGELKQAADRVKIPLDLLAAAVKADVEASEAAAANQGKVDIAWRLLHEASVVAAKEEAVLVPAVIQYVGCEAGEVLVAQHRSLADGLAQLGRELPTSPGFDLAVLEVLEILDDHAKELKDTILPALAVAPGADQRTLQTLAKHYRRAASTAPTRPHGWFLGTPDPSTAAASGPGATAALAATRDILKKMLAAPVKAGVVLVDAAADVARFGPGRAPGKL